MYRMDQIGCYFSQGREHKLALRNVRMGYGQTGGMYHALVIKQQIDIDQPLAPFPMANAAHPFFDSQNGVEYSQGPEGRLQTEHLIVKYRLVFDAPGGSTVQAGLLSQWAYLLLTVGPGFGQVGWGMPQIAAGPQIDGVRGCFCHTRIQHLEKKNVKRIPYSTLESKIMLAEWYLNDLFCTHRAGSRRVYFPRYG